MPKYISNISESLVFFFLTIQPFFKYEADWYRNGKVRRLVAAYYLVIRSILKKKPELKNCLKKCPHCGILFFTHPRNAGRNNIACPFGCRTERRREQSNKRSAEYNRSKEGKQKKKELNKRRQKKTEEPEASPNLESNQTCESVMNSENISYIRTLILLIDGFLMPIDAIVALIIKMRQHSIDIEK